METRLVSPHEALQQQVNGARFVDIREYNEYAREHIENAACFPLSELEKGKKVLPPAAGKVTVFYCQTGMRSSKNAQRLISATLPHSALFLSGGINAWKNAGLQIIEDRSQPLPIMRQVQIAAGTLVLLGVLLGYGVHSGFFLLSGFVGAGLIFAGVSGFCGMAKILKILPWNRQKR